MAYSQIVRRSAAGLVLVLVAALLVVAPGTAPAASDDLTAEQLCDLYPQDQGFAFGANPGNQSCFADLGDCHLNALTSTNCRSGIIKQFATAEEARANLHAGTAVAGLGEAAVEECDSWCTVEFARGRYWVWWSVAPALGLDTARQLAAQVDEEIERVIAGGSEPEEPPVEPEEPGQEPEEPGNGEPAGPGSSSAFVDVFYGTEGIAALAPDIRRVLDCGGHEPLDSYLECRGAALGAQAYAEYLAWFNREFPAATQRQSEGFQAYTSALLLAGLVSQDGTWMFPSIQQAMPLIEKLSDPAVCTRFIAMLAARDVADWPR
jgi:hypothetical protein